ncbi:MAG: hypothetical protein D4R68_07555 [Ignavibacteriales bacterium]|nr:MAG: hypothetical protein D4R68_07555 [Ignavibacteriales bacterium]
MIEPIDDGKPPAIPTDLQIFGAHDGEIGIDWHKNSESNITGYKIYRSINKPNNFIFITQINDNYFIDNHLEYDSTYYYKISVVNSFGHESPMTDFVYAKPINIYAPLSPSNVRINARNWSTVSTILLYWDPPLDTDIKGYYIYRSTTESLDADTLHYLDFTQLTSYFDTKNIIPLTKYYYRIKSVDKGFLKSPPTFVISDVVLNSPTLIFPSDNSIIKKLTEFRFKSVSLPATYKLVIQSNEVYGTVQEFNFTSELLDQELKVDVSNVQLESSKTYTWRVFTYTSSAIDPNSFSGSFTFTYIPY